MPEKENVSQATPPADQPKETDPLLKKDPSKQDTTDSDLAEAYGFGDHGTWTKPSTGGDECLTDYKPLKLSSFRVCCVTRGTIVANPVLFFEQMLLILMFFCSAAPIYIYFKTEVQEGEGSVKRFVREQENKMRAFASIMTGLAAFLLSFYTSVIVARWWTMRAGGIGGIKAAVVDLEMLLYQAVPNIDEKLLSAVRRYGRTSLTLIFLWRRKECGPGKEDLMKEMLLNRNLLTTEECDLITKWQPRHCLHETIWAWQMAIVNKLYQEKKIKSDQLYSLLLQKCGEGRQAVQLIHTHLAVRVPMQYVHLLGLLVKMHNFILTLIMGILFGAAWRSGKYILCVQLFARICILPFLFNAILLINCDLADPFDGSEADFPGDIYQEALEKDCQGMISATNHVPDWLRPETADLEKGPKKQQA
jgi:hypothetical protein